MKITVREAWALKSVFSNLENSAEHNSKIRYNLYQNQRLLKPILDKNLKDYQARTLDFFEVEGIKTVNGIPIDYKPKTKEAEELNKKLNEYLANDKGRQEFLDSTHDVNFYRNKKEDLYHGKVSFDEIAEYYKYIATEDEDDKPKSKIQIIKP